MCYNFGYNDFFPKRFMRAVYATARSSFRSSVIRQISHTKCLNITFKLVKEFLPATSKLHTRQIKTEQFLTFSNHVNVTCFKQLHEESVSYKIQ